ncbi:MAG: hypothetical protein WC500_06040 [Candidatus Margulisiibacteriota bacterium]
MKKNTIIALFSFILAWGLLISGCSSTSSSTATTTTTLSSTTTTLPGSGAAMISGTITLPAGLAGNLWVGATTDPTFASGVYVGEENYTITASDTTKAYSLPIGGATGTYYVIAVLAVNQTSYPGPLPLAGDRVGEYADGAVPASFGKTPSGTPTAIVYNAGDAVAGKNFNLNVTW